jgi:hypothetical protein
MWLLLPLLLLSCDPVIRRIVSFEFDPTAEHVTVTATTYVGNAKPKTAEYGEAEEERAALLAEHDQWSVRFAQLNADSDRVTYERSHGQLDSAQHVATVQSDQLQKLFFDLPITVTTQRGEGWMELTMYAGSSNRATLQQRRLAEKMLDAYSRRAVNYFNSVRAMYAYLDEYPQRARLMFTDIFADDDERPLLSDIERSLTDRVRESVQSLTDTKDIEEDATIDHIFDVAYNAFPAKFRVAIHGNVLAVEGFNRIDSENFEIQPPSVFEVIPMLEGRWISPDPLAAALRDEKKTSAEVAEEIASVPRRFDPVVTKNEVAAAILERMKPAPRYRLRWTTKLPAS